MKPKVRFARATNYLDKIVKMYSDGLGLKLFGSFQNHQGFDGVMLGFEGADYHFEFTHERIRQAPLSNSAENLIVLYCPDKSEFEKRKQTMSAAGFRKVQSHNPYWDENGITFEDLENYRIVICNKSWN